MSKAGNKRTGNLGEDLAAEYLAGKGFLVLERNLRLRVGEIDIFAKDKKQYVIVEVKTVSGLDFGPAKGFVTRRKQGKLRLLASELIARRGYANIRIDVIGILLENDRIDIEHIENAVCC